MGLKQHQFFFLTQTFSNTHSSFFNMGWDTDPAHGASLYSEVFIVPGTGALDVVLAFLLGS